MCAASIVVGDTSSIAGGAADIVSRSSSDHGTAALSAVGGFRVERACMAIALAIRALGAESGIRAVVTMQDQLPSTGDFVSVVCEV